ncbi:TPA: radical SAM protein, partial [Legionella pneumophila]|nr:radical SAM protein [Legionella pneumophila]HAT8182639.1 radical SAM protein [Legionella pneumophila]
MTDIIQLEKHFEAHNSLPKEAIIKADILRRGLNFDTDTLVDDQGTNTIKHQPKSYFIFSFDMVTQKELNEVPKWRAPEEIALFGGKYNLQRTIISVRLNPASSYRVTRVDDELWLYAGEDRLAQVYFREIPAYYGKKLADGRSVAELAPSIEWGY